MAAFNSRLLVHTSIASLVLSSCAYPVPVPVQSQPTTVTVTQGPAPQRVPPPAPAAPPAPAPQSVPPSSAPAQQSAPSQGSGFSTEQLDQMLAPIALYPDSLVAQILMAATYPSDVADAARWSKANPNLKGDEATKAVQNQYWDPAVQSMVAFPQVIQMMGAKPDWTQNLGDAFLASPKEVLDAAQRLRAKAQQQGNLKSSEQQKVVVEQAPETQQTIIKIEPANPETIYVPAYNPTVVYGPWPYPAYPPYYWPPDPFYYPGYYPGAAFASGVMWGIGFAAVGAIWGNCNWGGGDINIDVDRFNNINRDRQIDRSQNKFKHNAENRRGTPYRDQRSQQQFGRRSADAAQRNDYRGRDSAGNRGAQRQQAQSALQQRGFSQGGQRAGGSGFGGSSNAFQGARDPGGSRQQIDRGSASRQSFQQSGGFSGGSRASSGGFGGGARAGGGGGRGGGGRGGGRR